MMNKKVIVFTLITVSVIAIGTVVYFVRRDSSRSDAINLISSKQKLDMRFLENGDSSYLIAWAKALKSGDAKFQVAGITYQSSDGSAIPA